MTSKADSKRRVVLPQASPGDVFDVQELGEGRYVLVRLERPEPRTSLSREARLRALDEHPLRPTMSWEELRRVTREP